MPGGDIVVGSRWNTAATQTNARSGKQSIRTESFRVVSHEQITVPAGSFWAYKIESFALIDGARRRLARNTRWYTSDWGVPLKTIRHVTEGTKLIHAEVIELESRRRLQ
jgi:hypothetical protein